MTTLCSLIAAFAPIQSPRVARHDRHLKLLWRPARFTYGRERQPGLGEARESHPTTPPPGGFFTVLSVINRINK